MTKINKLKLKIFKLISVQTKIFGSNLAIITAPIKEGTTNSKRLPKKKEGKKSVPLYKFCMKNNSKSFYSEIVCSVHVGLHFHL